MYRIRLELAVFLFLGLSAALVGAPADAAAATAANTPPVLSVPGAQTVAEGALLSFDVTAFDVDGQLLGLTASPLPTGATFADHHDNTGTFSWTPASGQAGSYSVAFTANDYFGGIDTKSVAIDAIHVNNPPELNAIGDRTVERGSTVFVALSGYDPDGDALTYSAVGLPSYATVSDYGGGTGNIALAPVASTPLGVTSITVHLSDGSLVASQTFDVTVIASSVSNPPVLAPIGDQTVDEGSPRSVDLSAGDSDGDLLVWTVSLPGFANLVITSNAGGASTARLDLAPGYCASGSYPASVEVNDGALTDGESFTIQVADVNRPPAWSAPGGGYAMALVEGGASTLAVAASDPDQECGVAAPHLSIAQSDAGDALSLSLDDSGTGSGVLHVTAGSGSAGTYHITLRATDAVDASRVADTPVAIAVAASVGGDPLLAARAWLQNDPLRLHHGRRVVIVYLEPVNRSFSPEDVNLPSIRLTADGMGTVGAVAPIPDEFVLDQDRDRNGIAELRMEFAKDDLRALLANVSDPGATPLSLTASLHDGREVTADLGPNVIPERRHVIRHVGPNPLNPEAVVTISVDEPGYLRVRVFDPSGRLVRTLVDESSVPAGEREVRFNGLDDAGRRLASGRYFLRAESVSGRDVATVTILK
jgi:hypothetical protein